MSVRSVSMAINPIGLRDAKVFFHTPDLPTRRDWELWVTIKGKNHLSIMRASEQKSEQVRKLVEDFTRWRYLSLSNAVEIKKPSRINKNENWCLLFRKLN